MAKCAGLRSLSLSGFEGSNPLTFFLERKSVNGKECGETPSRIHCKNIDCKNIV